MDRHITGLWTQRSPLRDADVPYLYGKFYSASRFDSLIDGINREITARLTNARRAGSSPWNANTFPAINSFYPFKWIQGGSQTIRVIADGKDGVIYDATPGQKTALFTKSAGAQKTRFLGVGSTLFFTDGVDLQKMVRSYYVWAASTAFTVGQFIIDSNLNIQLVTTAGSTGGSAPAWAGTIGATTTDGTATWTCKGPSVQKWGITAPANAPSVQNTPLGSTLPAWAANTYYAPSGVTIVDSNNNIQLTTTGGTTGGSQPTWATGLNATTTDGSVVWTNKGTANWQAAHTYAAGIIMKRTWTQTIYLGIYQNEQQFRYVVRTFSFVVSGAGISGASVPTMVGPDGLDEEAWPVGIGQSIVDNTVTWTNIGQSSTWATIGASALVSLVAQIVDANGYLQNVIVPGKSGASAPTWATALNAQTADNNAVWQNAGPTTAGNTAAWIYGYSYGNSVSAEISTSSPQSLPIILANSSAIAVQGAGSADTQVDTVYVWRTAQGQSTLIFLAQVPNPGGGQNWNYVDKIPDSQLGAQQAAPIAGSNNPPPLGLTALEYHCGRIWGLVGNVIYYTNPPLAITGNSLSQWAPLNAIPLPEQGMRLFAGVTNQGPTLFAYGTSNIYAIFGDGTTANPFTTAVKYMDSVGLLSYDAITRVGSTHYLFTGKKKFVSLDPSAGYVEIGFPIGDQFNNMTTGANSGAAMGALYNPASTYVTWCEQSSGDTALYVSDGAVGWFRFSPVASPESGYLWSPRAAILGGTSAVQSVETSPGTNQLLIAPASSGPILFRDATVRQDYTGGAYASYPSWTVKGNIVLCQSGEVAEIAHIGLKSMAVGNRPLVGLLLGEIAATTATPFDTLQITSNDPPDLPASQTLYSDRYAALQNGMCPKCDNFQLKIDYGAQNAADEELVFSVYGAKHAERRQQ
jgi:hypothetical protein